MELKKWYAFASNREHEVKNKLCDLSKLNRIGHNQNSWKPNQIRKVQAPQRDGSVASIPEDANKGSATNTPGNQSQTAVF